LSRKRLSGKQNFLAKKDGKGNQKLRETDRKKMAIDEKNGG
jgi:hypothetical protein